MNDLYEVLQVRRSAEPEVIRAAYRALARKHHPDFGGSPERMAVINDAWAVLGNEAQRAAYDAREQTARPAPDMPPRRPRRRPPRPHPRRLRRPPGPAVCPAGDRRIRRTPGRSSISVGTPAGRSVGSSTTTPTISIWLARTPIGRRLTAEIETALAKRETAAAALRPAPQPQRQRSFTRPWAAARAG